jgi:hypothetical protein
MVINKIGIGSLFKVAACLYGSIGLVVGVGIFLVSLLGLGVAADSESGMPGWVAPIFGAGAIVILPLLYGTLGAIAVSIVAMLYNVAARTVGGVQVEVDRTP